MSGILSYQSQRLRGSHSKWSENTISFISDAISFISFLYLLGIRWNSPSLMTSFPFSRWSVPSGWFLLGFLVMGMGAWSGSAYAEEGGVLGGKNQAVSLVFQGLQKADADKLGKGFGALLEKMTGRAPETTSLPAGAEPPTNSLVVRLVPDLKASDDAFQIRTEGGRVVITSGGMMGLRFGFYELMQRLGCRFWAWDDEVIPRHPEIQVPPLDVTWTPSFLIHDLMNKEASTENNDFAFKLRGVSSVQFTGNHNIQPMLRKFADAHPEEVFPLVKTRDKATGTVTKEVREFNNIHYCYSAPSIAEALAEALEKEVIKRKGNLRNIIYFAGMGDGAGDFCECERCTKIYEEEAWTNPDSKKLPGYSATVLRMVNRAAEILDQKYPGIQVGTFAYMSLESPPGKTVPRKNVSIYLPRLRHSAATSVDDPKGENRTFWLNLQRWAEIASGRLDVWEYGANYANFLLPYPALSIMADNIKAYHKAGVRGLMIQGNYATMGGDSVVMNNWVWSRLMSNPSLDTAKLTEEFIEGYYGPAAPEIREYLKVLEGSLQAPGLPHVDEFSKALETYLTSPILEKLNAHIAVAKKLVSAPENANYLTLVNDLAMGLEAARLWKEGPLEEKDGRLIRTDFGYDTFPEALALWKSNRLETTPSELSSGKVKWLDFLALHGGPVATLHEGDLSARVWPAKRGGLGPILMGDLPVILETFDGALRFTEFVGKPTANSARISGEGGIGGWDPATKYLIEQEISLPDSRTIQVDFFDQRVTKSQAWSSAPHGTQTTYPITLSSKNFKFSTRDKAGAWHEVSPLPAAGKEILLPEVTAWRVEQPKAIVTDDFDQIKANPETPPINPKRPHLSGRLGINAEGNFYTVSNLQIDETRFDKLVPGFRRLIKIEQR